MEMFAKVILASRSDGVPDLVTLHLRYPRIIHAEMLRHRVMSGNGRSSRAVPAKVMLQEIRDTPFIPWHWTKNQPGMQGVGGHDQAVSLAAMSPRQAWLYARDRAVEMAEGFAEAGYHKQIFNRLVEPFMWIDHLVSATEWSNFFHLRDHPDAEPHIRDLAVMIRQAIHEASYQELVSGKWHLPYIDDQDWRYAYATLDERPYSVEEFLCRVSAARCARISYAPFDGNTSYERELERFDKLVGSDAIHASPMEHQAFAAPDGVDYRNFRGWQQFRTLIEGETR